MREFDIDQKRFIPEAEGGFRLPEAKSDLVRVRVRVRVRDRVRVRVSLPLPLPLPLSLTLTLTLTLARQVAWRRARSPPA